MKLSLGMAIVLMALGALTVESIERVVVPKMMYGWNEVDDKRSEECKIRARKWHRRITFQVERTYDRCMKKAV